MNYALNQDLWMFRYTTVRAVVRAPHAKEQLQVFCNRSGYHQHRITFRKQGAAK
jgi:hypothetical protein